LIPVYNIYKNVSSTNNSPVVIGLTGQYGYQFAESFKTYSNVKIKYMK